MYMTNDQYQDLETMARRIHIQLSAKWHENLCGCLRWPTSCLSGLLGQEPDDYSIIEVLETYHTLMREYSE